MLDIDHLLTKAAFNLRVRRRLYRKLAAMLTNGTSLLASLEEMERRATRQRQTGLARVMRSLTASVRSGRLLGQCFAPWVSRAERLLLDAGAQSGREPETLLAAARFLEAQQRMRSMVRRALTQPIVLLFAVLVLLFIVGDYVTPKIEQVLPPNLWTGSARGLYVLSQIVDSPWVLVPLMLIVALAALVQWSLPNWAEGLRTYADRLPPWSFYRVIQGSSWLNAFAALTEAGVSQTDALRQMLGLHAGQDPRELDVRHCPASPWLRVRVHATLMNMLTGADLGKALLDTGFEFPDREIIDDIATYSSLPNFEQVLNQLGTDAMQDGLERLSAQAGLLNNLALILMAALMAWITIGTIAIQQNMSAHFMGMGG